jgi:CcmD family protein
VKSYAFLFWAYNVIWLGLASYIALIAARLARADRKLDALESRSRSRGGP